MFHFGSNVVQFLIYFLSAFAFYKLAKIRCIQNPWLVFIPFFSLYIIGYIGDTLKYNNPRINQYLGSIPLAYALPIGSMLPSLLWGFPLIGGLLGAGVSLAVYLGQLVVYYLVFDHYTAPNQKTLFTLLSIIPVVGPVLILYTLKDSRSY